MKRRMSLFESLVNVAVGLHVAVVIVFPLFGLPASLADNLAIAAIAPSYALRRLFEAIRVIGAGHCSRRRGADQSAFPDASAGEAKR